MCIKLLFYLYLFEQILNYQIIEAIGNTTDFSKFNSAKKAQLKQLGIASQKDLNKFLGIEGSAVPAQQQGGLTPEQQQSILGRIFATGVKVPLGFYDILMGNRVGSTAEATGLFQDANIIPGYDNLVKRLEQLGTLANQPQGTTSAPSRNERVTEEDLRKSLGL